MNEVVRATYDITALPPMLAGDSRGSGTVGDFYNTIAAMFEAWVGRRIGTHPPRVLRRCHGLRYVHGPRSVRDSASHKLAI